MRMYRYIVNKLLRRPLPLVEECFRIFQPPFNSSTTTLTFYSHPKRKVLRFDNQISRATCAPRLSLVCVLPQPAHLSLKALSRSPKASETGCQCSFEKSRDVSIHTCDRTAQKVASRAGIH